MEQSGEVFNRLLERLRETLPEVAAQVEDEVRRGRQLP